MKQYVIDELRPEDHKKIKSYMETQFGPADMGEIYWIPLDTSLYDGHQQSHDECRPFYFSVHLTTDALIVELLIRTKNRIRCDCIHYANEKQFFWMVQLIDAILETLEIIS